MAKESFDKEIQFLRLLALTGGGYDRQQFAGRLGISVHTFDKTVRKLREISGDADFADLFRYGYADSAEPVLLFLYRAKSMKESESRRLPLILTALKGTPQTAAELLDACCERLPLDAAMPDEKTIRSDLRYLEEIGVVRREPGGRPYRYVLNNDLTDCLSQKELIDLYEFVDIMANTQIPSVQGYLLRDNLKKALKSAVPEEEWDDGLLEPFSYKYHYDARILDEAHLYTLLRTIHLRKRISFQYFSPKNRKSYSAKETNPLFGRETEVRRESTLPLKVVYDHQYGRWYLIGAAAKGRFVKFRMEGMIDIAEEQEAPDEYFALKKQQLDEQMRHSWLIDTGETVTVRAKFYRPRGQADFIAERVRLQGQWGQIVEENEDFFIYEIQVNGVTEIRPWLRGFGSSCEVLAPADLRQSFIDEWKEIGDYYE
ncbi:helix-turn-helix transcriptional regulator [Saccharibacillus sacchari]|uniref:helix-turn-helix transcriptional regulator n=1 Tax=Saccharibacillus sacchari TaxID=456493 RepID=UPI0004B9DD1A|nr:WYL domain-containing protein [Saccharibacillus sacchari]